MAGWLVLGIVASAVGAICARHLVNAALWLAASSVLLAILWYFLNRASVKS